MLIESILLPLLFGTTPKFSSNGAATAADLIKKLTQLPNGNKIVETWDAGRYGRSVFDAAGNWIDGIRIPLPTWPPRW